MSQQLFERSYRLEDIAIRAGGDGRTVTAYAAVFDTPAEVRDFDGHYMETITRTAFDKTLAERSSRVQVFYNHGKTLYGTPSERFSLPIGVPEEIRADDRGLLTVTRYNRTELADEVLEAIRNGDITSQSFSGRIFTSKRPPEKLNGLKQIVRTELGLTEYGPTPIPSYDDAAVVGVRFQQLVESLDQLDEEQRLEVLSRYGTLPTIEEAPPESDVAGAEQATTTEDSDSPVSGDHVSGPSHAERQQRMRALTLQRKFT